MVGLNSRACALLLSVSFVALATAPAVAQTATGQASSRSQTEAKRDRAVPAAQSAAPAANPRDAYAQAAGSTQSLDAITVVASKNEEKAIDALAPASAITLQQIQQFPPNRLQDVFVATPGVSFQDRGDEPSTSINIRGLQDFGRVAVVVDGARQNYQRSGHGAQGSFFLDPELIGGIDVVRGPSANIYGSGAIGGVVSFRTKDIDDVVRAGERWGVDLSGSYGSNNARGLGSVFGGVRVDPSVDVFGGAVYRTQGNYKDGAGTEIGNTGNDLAAGLLKFTVRPADGHEVKIGGIFQDFNYDVGQFNRGPVVTTAQRALYQGSSVYGTNLQSYTGTLNWKYSRPDDTWFDWNIGLYGNRTNSDQTKTYHYSTSGSGYCGAGNFGNDISGCIGDTRGYNLDTIGIDVNNTSRFEYGDWRTAVTYGVDAFNDKVTTWDSRGNSNITTPSGERTVSGGFVQVKNNYAHWLEVIGAARYDHYELTSQSSTASGSRLSPKVTVGVTPIAGFTPYVAYAEGYRAPSITETLIAGAHATGGGPALFNCGNGTSGLFCLIPNTGLRPEVGKNKEVGINLKYNDIFVSGDSFRGKINAFRNDVDNYIELVGSTPEVYRTVFMGFPLTGVASKYYQYQNIPHARIEGVEVETSYDAGMWFVGVNAAVIRGKDTDTGLGLASVPARKVVTTGGLRLLDRQLTIAAQWASYAANTNLPAGYLPGTSYDLVNLNVAYRPTADVTLNFSIDNLLNNYYRPYAVPGSSVDGTGQNDVLWTSPGPGIVYKGGIKVHFGGA
ncbi:TonB-dependent hemoglobin/transferrin/lactoferrin family receptor [Rhodopseudomonas sp. BR0M22]|uniref:TonB-dependent hemoglobin/transferrin/lactoferrin family receptor n=1 Tax=Rhodopseudomonas sp. BR0M22 TaxID=2269369 RepID=UPI0013DFA33E|nr:TonB-dependent hemoglobin/transferrin/lactoferrin family receptor [Rhodopseudomonas sp. BR0M22]NEW91151.1 TonB-dependent hemoglobin/transferrin/lactoferrin family receptor [Rhodopseudomonas sp. BR0M22]